MKKAALIFLIVSVYILLICSQPAQAKYSGGTGEPNDPYLISTAEDLNDINNHPNDLDKHFLLTADIDLAGYTGGQFNIIGSSEPFSGVFNGNSYTISNFSYTSTGKSEIGLFSLIKGPNSIIKDLTLVDPNVDGGSGSSIGALAGYLWGGTIAGCSVENGIISGDRYVGGIVGGIYKGTVSDSNVITIVSGDDGVGGLVGDNLVGTIFDCYATVDVVGDDWTGGLVGRNTESMVTNCHVAGNVTGDDYTGGIVGYNWSSNIHSMLSDSSATCQVAGAWCVGGLVGKSGWRNHISGCYATGQVDGYWGVGGLVGYHYDCMITNSYATGQVSGTVILIGGLVGLSGDDGTISNCYATGQVGGDVQYIEAVGGLVGGNLGGTVSNSYATGVVTGNERVGGLVGDNDHTGQILDSYSTGSVSGTSEVGGLVGRNNNSETFDFSFWDVNTTGQTVSAAGTGLTTTEMQIESTFTSAGWDFNTPIWTIDEGVDYPRLWWEAVAGPVESTDELAEELLELGLPQGLSNSLLAKLDSALQVLEDENENSDVAAINSLQAFINAVNAQRGKKISEEDADYLVAAAQQIIAMLSDA